MEYVDRVVNSCGDCSTKKSFSEYSGFKHYNFTSNFHVQSIEKMFGVIKRMPENGQVILTQIEPQLTSAIPWCQSAVKH